MRIALLAAVPTIGLIVMGLQLGLTSLGHFSEGKHVLDVAHSVPVMSAVVHEMQIERGMTSGFMSSGGTQFATELPAQRKNTDAAIAAFHKEFTPDVLNLLGRELRETVLIAGKAIDAIATTRDAVDASSVPTSAALGYYTTSIHELIEILSVSIDDVDSTATVEALIALESLVRAKEAAGLERATGAAVFSTKTVDGDILSRLSNLIGTQSALLFEFQELGSPEVNAAFEQNMADNDLKTFRDYRQLMLDGASNPGVLDSVTPSQWFAASTDRINRLHKIEQLADDDVVALANSINTSARLNLIWTISLNVGVIVLSLVLAWLVARSIVPPIRHLTETMTKLSEGDTSVGIDAVDQKDEIGDMARAVQVFKDNAIKVAAMSEEENARIETARVRAEAMSELIDSLGMSVDAAVEGDFSRRVSLSASEQDLQKVADNVNQLLSTTDTALGEIGQVLSALAEKDLTRRVTATYAGAFEALRSDTNSVAERFNDIIGGLQDTSRTLRTATGEILSGANDLSERTTRQAATIEETSAAMEQLSHTVMDSAGKARDASNEAHKASNIVEEGAEVMSRANQAMERISTSSEKISNIIGMIDDIAFQTNLLALNASVEAARAGESGKGFAVVAVEVRRLAQSAAEASSGVKELIEQSSHEVRNGSQLVRDVAERLTGILDAVNSNTRLLEAIAAESKEQANSIHEVTTAVRQMDEMTQQNAALVEQMNAAIEQTEAQAADLDGIVELFEINDGAKKSSASGALRRAS